MRHHPLMRAQLAAAATLAIGLPTATAIAQPQRDVPPAAETVTVIPGPSLAGSGLHELIFGASYRDLWTTPIEADVLDLDSFAGGLEPVMIVGRLQTLGLALRGADGRAYTFRSIYKDLVRSLPEPLQDTPIADIAQDQLSAGIPTGAGAAIALSRAAGVLETAPRIVVMPDDPRLGEFREQFAGRLGTISEYPTGTADGGAGTFGATEIVDAREMLDLIEDREGDVDRVAFLRARLVDLLLGDWDRHVGQWRFARLPGHEDWQPTAEDRDQAFSRYEGIAMMMARNREPKFGVYGPEYQAMEGLVWNARSVDRYLLGGLDRDAYVRTARRIQESLSDAVIEEAIRQLPPEHFAIAGPRLIDEVRARRDGLVDEAERFYEFLSGEVNLFGTRQGDLFEIEFDDGSVAVTVSPLADDSATCAASPGGAPDARRRFLPSDTHSIRLYTGAGPDRVVLRGGPPGAIDVKIVGGEGNNIACDLAGREHGFGLDAIPEGGAGPTIAANVWLSPGASLEEAGEPEEGQGPMLRARRDWGSTSWTVPLFGWQPDPGMILGMSFIKETFGFRKRPYASHHEFRFRFAFRILRPAFDYSGTFRSENRNFYWNLRAVASGMEGLNFYGFGNDTVNDRDEDEYRVRQSVLKTNLRAAWVIGEHLTLSTGPIARYTFTRDDTDRVIGEIRPYGFEDTGQIGWTAGINFNNRRFPGNRNLKGSDDIFRFGPAPLGEGFAVDLDLAYYPKLWDLRDDYGRAIGSVSYTGIIGSSTAWQLKVGGTGTFGDVPYFDAAYVGAHEIRGLRRDRFAGDEAAYANAGLMQRVGKINLVIPGRWGILLRGDGGRVWLRGEDSDTWHWSYGGGLWWAPWDFMTAVRAVYFRSDDDQQFYFLLGFEI